MAGIIGGSVYEHYSGYQSEKDQCADNNCHILFSVVKASDFSYRVGRETLSQTSVVQLVSYIYKGKHEYNQTSNKGKTDACAVIPMDVFAKKTAEKLANPDRNCFIDEKI